MQIQKATRRWAARAEYLRHRFVGSGGSLTLQEAATREERLTRKALQMKLVHRMLTPTLGACILHTAHYALCIANSSCTCDCYVIAM